MIEARLTDDEVETYRKTGVLFPLPVLTPDALKYFRGEVDELERLLHPRREPALFGECHLTFRWAFELCSYPAILDIVEQIIGPDILVHSTTLFSKPPGRRFVSWHQDGSYWRLSEPRLVSVWVALSESTIENGCMRVQPNTHLENLEHTSVHHEDNMLATGNTAVGGYDESQAVDVTLRPGEMSLHHVNLLHGSNANQSNDYRIGYAIRYVAPCVRQGRGHQKVLLVRGEDQYDNFEKLLEPPALSVAEGLHQHLVSTDTLEKQNFDQIHPASS